MILICHQNMISKKTGVEIKLSPKKVNSKKLVIGIAYNAKKKTKNKEIYDKYAEFDDISTIKAIQKAIEEKYKTVLLEADTNFVEKLKKTKPDFVFNIAEGINGESRESHIPAILEMFGIPYSGSGVLTQAITLDKNKTKELLEYYKIPTPKFQLIENEKFELKNMRFPIIVKPNSEGSSKGITNKSLVFNKKDLIHQVKYVLKTYKEPVIIEEFLDGREFTVSIIGNNNPKVLPIVEVTFDYLPKNIHKFDSYEVKWIYDNPNSPVDPIVCPAKISESLKRKIETNCLRAYNKLNCVDFCRMDVRLDKNEEPNILEINALPGLIPDPKENSRFPRACFTAGMSYNEIILTILKEGMNRYNIK